MRRTASVIGQRIGQGTHDRLERRREVSYRSLVLTALICLVIGWVIGLVQNANARAPFCELSAINAIFLSNTHTGEQSGWIVTDGAGQATLQEESGTRFLSISGYLDGPIGLNLESESSNTTSPLSSVFTPEVQYWSEDIIRWSNERGLDPNLTATVMQIESCGRPDAKSNAGAKGLFQVMPFHFQLGEDPSNPETNANRGLSYLLGSYQRAEGDLAKTFAGYNGGHSVITWNPQDWAEETQDYVYWGTGILQDISQGLEKSPRLQEWLEAGGFGLCQKAQIALNLP